MTAKGRSLICLCVLILPLARANDLTPAGNWTTIDDKTGKPRSVVRIYEDNGTFFGKVEKILDPARAERKCEKCTDDRKDQPIAGMVIVRNMKNNAGQLSGGDILDPDSGSVYRCKMKVIDNGRKLSVRGYMGVSILGRTQTWVREVGP
jgi:uncharacterized protein (DUF2147 family)